VVFPTKRAIEFASPRGRTQRKIENATTKLEDIPTMIAPRDPANL
tara:strand:+ start:840 stop:974 length:135 start_codon:yes stop_codon:yes gene_type:complete